MYWPFERTCKACSGQATVEAAVAIPVAFLLLLLLVQPAIVLYDRTVMENAAAEACRLLATCQGDHSVVEDYVRRRLSAIPQAEIFHKHDRGCSWEIELEGGPHSSEVRVRLATKLRPLPLLGQMALLAGTGDEEGCWKVEVEETLPVTAPWQ